MYQVHKNYITDPDGTDLERCERVPDDNNAKWVKYFTNDPGCNFHRSNGPAHQVWHQGTDLIAQECWYLGGDPVSIDDQPSEIQYALTTAADGTQTTYKQGECWILDYEFHRENKPAFILYDQRGVIVEQYYKHGVDITEQIAVLLESNIKPGTKEWEFTWDLL